MSAAGSGKVVIGLYVVKTGPEEERLGSVGARSSSSSRYHALALASAARLRWLACEEDSDSGIASTLRRGVQACKRRIPSDCIAGLIVLERRVVIVAVSFPGDHLRVSNRVGSDLCD
jgi:hypothetical protein